MINCAIAGLGRWGRSLVDAASHLDRFNITRAVETDIERARGFCVDRKIDLSGNLDSVLNDPAIDAVLLATPHSLHRAQLIAAAAKEKQVCFAKSLWRFAATTRARCSTPAAKPMSCLRSGHNRRFWPSMRALREIVTSGELGTILHVEGHNSNENSNSIMQGWRLSPEESPGGGLTGAGLHVLDGFVSLLGPARQVYARLSSREVGPPPLDSAMLAIDFASGVTATLATVRATPFYWRVHMFGTEGSAEVLDETTMVLRSAGSGPQRVNYEPADSLAAELSSFADAIENKRAFPVVESEVLATLAAFEAALRSMISGHPSPAMPAEPRKARTSRYRDIAAKLQKEIRLGNDPIGELLPSLTELMGAPCREPPDGARGAADPDGSGPDRATRRPRFRGDRNRRRCCSPTASSRSPNGVDIPTEPTATSSPAARSSRTASWRRC